MILKCNFPFSTTGAHLAKDALDAIKIGIPLEELPPAPHRLAVYLSVDQAEKVRPVAVRGGLKMAETLERLAYGMYQARLKGRQRIEVSAIPEAERQRAYLVREAISGLDAGQIVVAEASTGLGKSRIMAHAVKHLLGQKKNVVWVAAPTVVVLLHLLDEFAQVDAKLRPSLLFGRQQFVSVRRLRNLFDDLEEEKETELLALRPEVEKWLASGAPPRCLRTRKIAEFVPGMSHLVEDLLDLAPNISSVLVSMREKDPSEPAEAILARLSEDASQSQLVFCTHTMLLLRSKVTSGDNPALFTHLLVDEVHQLEKAAAELEFRELSLLSLRVWLRRQKFTKGNATIKAVNKLMIELASDPRLDEGFGPKEEVVSKIRRALSPIYEILKKARKGDAASRVEREELMETIGGLLDPQEDRIGLRFSPIRRYPSILAGPMTVGPTLGHLWKSAAAAVGFSGTIYLPTVGGGISSGYMVAKLAIPRGRVRAIGPVISSWITSSTTLMHPSPACVARLCFPKNDENVTENGANAESTLYGAWLDSAAKVIQQAADQARGGTLVLCTAFRDVQGLRARLVVGIGGRLIAQSKGISIQAQTEAFIASYRNSIRPVWLATGGAWTGLDLRDRDADFVKKDSLLTDLMILRVPIGMDRTSTHWARKQTLGFQATLFEASILFRQGIGRLIRREGLKDRKLWILDGRLYSPNHQHFRALHTVLKPYRNQKTFDVLESGSLDFALQSNSRSACLNGSRKAFS